MKNIILTEEQTKMFMHFIKEGTDMHSNNGKLEFSINKDRSDKQNLVLGDTRAFDTKEHILNGDGTYKGHSFGETTNHYRSMLSDILLLKNYALNNFGEALPSFNSVDRRGKDFLTSRMETIKKCLNNPNKEQGRNDLLNYCESEIGKVNDRLNLMSNTYDRINNINPEEEGYLINIDGKQEYMIPKYIREKVQGTNVDVISLFFLGDFNFSDAIKNGTVRQNPMTDSLLGIKDYNSNSKVPKPFSKDGQNGTFYMPNDVRQQKLTMYGKSTDAKLPVTYDGSDIKPNIQQNFSLDDNGKRTNEGGYNSVQQFLDKSLMMASWTLKKINYLPDVIISVPSSSNFNKFYCQRLSQKIGVPYVQDFFKRDLYNIKLDNEEELKKGGISDDKIHELKEACKLAIKKEVINDIKGLIKNFVNEYGAENIFNNTRIDKGSRTMANYDIMSQILFKIAEESIIDAMVKSNDESCFIENMFRYMTEVNNADTPKCTKCAGRGKVYRALTNGHTQKLADAGFNTKFSYLQIKPKSPLDLPIVKCPFCNGTGRRNNEYNYQYMYSAIKNLFVKGAERERFNELMSKIYELLNTHRNLLYNGKYYKMDFNSERSKVTTFDMRYRKYVHGFYAVLDKYLDKNSKQINDRYGQKKFLLFDEDINSGASLRFTIEAMKDVGIGNGQIENNVLCLTNGWGFKSA